MVLDRKTAVAGLVLAVLSLSPWPVIDSSPLQSGISLGGGVFVVIGLSERTRFSRLVMGLVRVLFVVQGVYEGLSRASWVDLAVGLLYGDGSDRYQSGFAPWGIPGGATDSP